MSKEVINILMKRDGMTEQEAKEVADDVREEMLDAIDAGDYSLAEEIFEDDLGLEPDYIMDFLY